jgi:hypothetical protein
MVSSAACQRVARVAVLVAVVYNTIRSWCAAHAMPTEVLFIAVQIAVHCIAVHCSANCSALLGHLFLLSTRSRRTSTPAPVLSRYLIRYQLHSQQHACRRLRGLGTHVTLHGAFKRLHQLHAVNRLHALHSKLAVHSCSAVSFTAMSRLMLASSCTRENDPTLWPCPRLFRPAWLTACFMAA